ncbi:MAG: hypothetical protein KAT70_06480 [Thermoplasmata archaeon]|nr:hypothetical protein [Thermoplasmata archaeon]
MPAPTTPLDWAADATYTGGPTGIPGTANKVAPASGFQDEGYIPQDKLAAQHLNWFQNLCGLWAQWLETERARLAGYIGGATGTGEWAYPSARSRLLVLDPDSGWDGSVVNNQTVGWSIVTATATSGSGPILLSRENSAIWSLPISNFVPSGSVITRVRALVKPGAVRATNFRMSIIVGTQVFDFDAPEFVSDTDETEVEDDGTTDMQTISSGTISITTDRSTDKTHARVICGSDAGTNYDRFFAIEVQFDDPGPRNH